MGIFLYNNMKRGFDQNLISLIGDEMKTLEKGIGWTLGLTLFVLVVMPI